MALENKLLPASFIEKVKQFIPKDLSVDEFIAICHRPLRKSIRVNTLRISVEDFIARMTAQEWLLEPVPWCQQGFWLERPAAQEDEVPLGNTFEHMAGLFYIQEASSMMPPLALESVISEANHVLDVAAAPGSKTTQLAALMNNEGTLIANEFSSSRLKVLHSSIRRCGVKNVSLTHFDGRVFGKHLVEQFDAILLDAPCGGEGTVRKDPDAMDNWSQQAVEELSSIQKELIISAFRALKPGGRLVYSTCTLSPEENQHVCQHLVSEFGEYLNIIPMNELFVGAEKCTTEEGYLQVWPQIYDSEGFFVACFEKTFSLGIQEERIRARKFPFSRTTRKQYSELSSYIEQQFGFSLPEDIELYQRDKELWWFPQGQSEYIKRLKCDRMGIKIAETYTKGKQSGFRIQHEFAISCGKDFSLNTFELDLEQLKSFYQGKDIPISVDNNQSGEVLLKYQGYSVGLGKWLNNRIKNSLPREMVRDSRLIS